MTDWNVSNLTLITPKKVIPAKAGIQKNPGFRFKPEMMRSKDLDLHVLILAFDIPLKFACLPVGRDFDI
jgi:hypothetical protein